MISLSLTLGEGPRTATKVIEFLIIDMPPAYNGILGSPLKSPSEPSHRHNTKLRSFQQKWEYGQFATNKSRETTTLLSSRTKEQPKAYPLVSSASKIPKSEENEKETTGAQHPDVSSQQRDCFRHLLIVFSYLLNFTHVFGISCLMKLILL